MTVLASRGQLRASFLRWALVIVPAVSLLGFLSGRLAQSGPGNPWFDTLTKPAIYPPPGIFGIVWPVAIAFFLWQGATAAVQTGRIHEVTSGLATEVLEPLVLVAGSTPVSEVETAVAQGAHVAAADPAGWPLGLVDAESAVRVPAEARGRTAVASVTIAQPTAWVVALAADAALTDLIRVMSERDLSQAVVIDDDTRDVRGLATAERINAVVGAELGRRGRR